jgi:hypothetical protein
MFQTYQSIGFFVRSTRSKRIKKTSKSKRNADIETSGPMARRKRRPLGAESPTEARNSEDWGERVD